MVATLGLAWAAWHASHRLAEQLPASAEGRRLSISGYVCGTPTPGSFRSLRFSFCVTQWHGLAEHGRGYPRLLRLAWYGPDSMRLPAHRLRLAVSLKRPHGVLNGEGFRYEDWLFRHGYRATGTVRAAEPDSSVSCGVHCGFHRTHSELTGWVKSQFSSARHLPLIASLLVGYRGELTRTHWQVLQATGTVHLVAISGLHLGLIALGAGFVFRRLLLALPVAWLGEIAQRRLLFAVVMTCCLGYALAAGFTVPTRRAMLMVMVGGWTLLAARQASVWHSLVWALGAIVFLDPFAPLDQGFWLSFGAVSVLICAFAGGLGVSGWVWPLLVAQGAVFAGLWPVLQVFDQNQPLVGVVANLMAIPWVSLVVMPVLIAGGLLSAMFPNLSGLAILAFDAVLDVLWFLLATLAEFEIPDIDAGPAEVLGLAVLVLVVICFPLAASRWAGALLILGWLGLSLGQPGRGNSQVLEPEVTVWDVGQGLAVMVRHGRKVLLYDTGPAVPGVFSSVESTLLPNLKALGIHRIDTLVVSHGDSDHSGGLALLADSVEIGQLVTGEVADIREKLGGSAEFPVIACGDRIDKLGDLKLSYWQVAGARSGNNASCVVRIEHRASGIEWILPGDITSEVERHYLAHLDAQPRPAATTTRVVLAPHHGSKTSSSPGWVSALAPDIVIYSAGYRHRFGHPHPSVTSRYRSQGGQSFNTACSGSLIFAVANNRLTINEKRHDAPFWIGGPGQARAECRIP